MGGCFRAWGVGDGGNGLPRQCEHWLAMTGDGEGGDGHGHGGGGRVGARDGGKSAL